MARTAGSAILAFALLASCVLLLYIGRTAHTTRDAFADTIAILVERTEKREQSVKVPPWATPASREDQAAAGLRALLASVVAIDRVRADATHGLVVDIITRNGEMVRIYADTTGSVYRIEPVP